MSEIKSIRYNWYCDNSGEHFEERHAGQLSLDGEVVSIYQMPMTDNIYLINYKTKQVKIFNPNMVTYVERANKAN